MRFLALLSILFLSEVAIGQTFYAVDEYPPGPGTTLIGGTPADPADWPAEFYSQQGNARCTSTVAGPQAMLTAAHCVSNGSWAKISHRGKVYQSTCYHHPDYKGNKTADWAICKISQAMPALPYENINTNPDLVTVGNKVLLTGYGCTKPGGGGGNDGVYRIGWAKVARVPFGSNHDIVTNNGAALCFGDSGGPAFFYTDKDNRYQISINSRGNISTTSYLSSIASKPFLEWARTKAGELGIKICGIHADAEGCRTVAPRPDPNPDPQPDPDPQPEPQPDPDPGPGLPMLPWYAWLLIVTIVVAAGFAFWRT